MSNNIIKITFTENGTQKCIALIKSPEGGFKGKRCIWWLDNSSSETGQFFGEAGGEGTLGLLDLLCVYAGKDYSAQFERVKTELNKYSWQKRN